MTHQCTLSSYGKAGPSSLTADVLHCSAPTVTPPAFIPDEWTVAIQQVGATQLAGSTVLGPNTVNFCSPTSGCTGLIDTGTFDIEVPPATAAAIFTLLGLGPTPALTVTSSITGRGNSYPSIGCGILGSAGPTLDFQIQDRLYSLAPTDYVLMVYLNSFLPFPVLLCCLNTCAPLHAVITQLC